MGVPDFAPLAPCFIVRNDVSGYLASGISDSATSIDVTIPLSAFGWNASNADMQAYATIREGDDVEVVIITLAEDLSAGVSSTLTVTRAADSTAALAFTTGAVLSLNANAGMLDMISSRITQEALISGSNSHRYGVYANATTFVHATYSTSAYIYFPYDDADFSHCTIIIRNQSAGTPTLYWMSDAQIIWASGSEPAFSGTVDYIIVEAYHINDDSRILCKWSGYEIP